MAPGSSVLVIDDEELLRMTLIDELASTGRFEPRGAGTLTAARQALADHDAPVDAVILDVGLPDGDGRQFCAELREHGFKIPVVMLTGMAEESDVVAGLDAGADDYVVKPFRVRELLARIDRAIETFKHSRFAVFDIGPYVFRPSQKLVHDQRSGRNIRLTDRESRILRTLREADGASIDRQVLLQQQWGYNPTVKTHTLETHIYRLRQKIEDDPLRPRYILTSESGYRLDVSTKTPQTMAPSLMR